MKQLNLLRILFIASLALPVQVLAQSPDNPKKIETPEMNVDMPDETVETDVVDKGQFQIESAFLYNHFKEQPHASIGQLLLRYGVTKRVELKLLVEDGKNRDRYMEETVQSNYPLGLGAKVVLLKDHDWLPDVTFATLLKLPLTSRSKEQSAYWSPVFLFAFQNKFGEQWKLEYNAGIQQEVFSADWVWLANGSLHYKILPPFEMFVEYYAQYKAQQLPQHNLGGGFAWQPGNQVELYLSGGSTIDQEDYNYFFSGGIAFRTF